MTTPDHLVTHSADPLPVRPGTSAALTARTIDATVRPPLVKAQEAVAAIVPRLAVPMTPPLLAGTLGLTVVLVMIATQRIRFRPSVVLLSGLLMMPVSSFRAAQEATEVQVVDDATSRESESFKWFEMPEMSPPIPESVELPDLPIPPFDVLIVPFYEGATPGEMIDDAPPPIEMELPQEEESRMSRRRDHWREEESRMSQRRDRWNDEDLLILRLNTR